jgi:hypothetical protein
MRTTALFALCLLAAATWVLAQNPPAPAPNGATKAPAKDDAGPAPIPGLTDRVERRPGGGTGKSLVELLGEPFESQAAGLTFSPPANCKRVPAGEAQHQAGHVVEYTDDDRQWLLKVTRSKLAQKMPLQTANGQQGLLDYTVADVLKMNPAAEVLRQDIINVDDHGVGIAITRFSLGTQRYLRQQAIYQVDEQNYYVFNLTTPAAKAGKPEDDPNETLAAETFKAMIETIKVLDRKWIRTDQEYRLFRTRALFLDWKTKGGKQIRDAVVPQQWLRIVKNGKDIGYSYVAEEFTEGKDVKSNPARAFDGVLVSSRTRTFDQGRQVDVGSQQFVSLDRKHEDWATVMNMIGDKEHPNFEKKQSSEYGFSELKLTRIIDRSVRDPNAANGTARDAETYKLSVSRPLLKDTRAKAEYHTPSVFYIPQAIGSMLPRLLPLNRAVTYMFQFYVGGERDLILRYVDVGFQKAVMLDGQNVQAIPITDRIRIEGVPTVHYMSPEGKYLGSVTRSEDQTFVVLPTTKADLEKRWPGAKIWPFEAEGPVVEPAPGGGGTSVGSLGR